MKYDFKFAARKLDGTPLRGKVGTWGIEYLAFSHEANQNSVPVVFLSGAFQNFHSFRYEVEAVLAHFPVILIDLPSQGNNLQLAPELGLVDLADLLHSFLVHHNVPVVHVIGVSYGSLVASLFAQRYPSSIGRLLLGGTTGEGRPAMRLMLEESFHLCEAGRFKEFAQGAVSTMVNGFHKDKTGISGVHRKLLLRQMLRLSEADRERFLQNTRRLLRFSAMTDYPVCPTLVATGEFDHFTMPHENAAFALKCRNATFALIRNADHLGIFTRRKGACDLFLRFLREEPLHTCDAYRVYSRLETMTLDRRISQRQVPVVGRAVLSDEIMYERSGQVYPARIEDITYFGCRVTLLLASQTPLPIRNLQLTIESLDLTLPVHILEPVADSMELRCQFIHRDLAKADSFRRYLLNKSAFIAPRAVEQQPVHSQSAGFHTPQFAQRFLALALHDVTAAVKD